jgi:8-oxo-dGTP diphosphatase
VTDVTDVTPRVAAGVLFRDDAGRILLVKPSYKPGWEIPGGYVEHSESPLAAAVREVNEELGVHLAITDLLVLDWAPHPDEGDKLLVIFRGGILTPDDVTAFQLKADEIVQAAFFDASELEQLMPSRLARRVAQAAAGDHGTYLEHGQPPS